MTKVKIILNGEDRFIEQNTTLLQLVSQLELDCKKIAIEKDLEIINPQNFGEIFLQNDSRVEIVHFIGGG
jgi:thiamine biosynthesis protein ThiS